MNAQPSRESRRRGRVWVDVVVVVSLVLFAALLRLPVLDTGHRVPGDESMWGNAALNTLKHPLLILNASHALPRKEITPKVRYVLFNRSAAYPLLIAGAVSIFGNTLFGLRFVSVFCGILLIPLVYFLAKKTFGRLQALAAGLLTATLPLAVLLSRTAFNESLTVLLGYLAILLALRETDKLGALNAALVGFIIGYAYLIKAFEVLVIVAPAFAALLLIDWSRKRFWWMFRTGIVATVVVFIPTLLRLMITPWTVMRGLESLWFDDNYAWKQPISFYFEHLGGEFSLLLGFVAVGVLSVLYQTLVLRLKNKNIMFLFIACMVFVISLPSTKKLTYLFIVAPAFLLLAAEGLAVSLNVRKYPVALRLVFVALLICLPLASMFLGLQPAGKVSQYYLLSDSFMQTFWPVGLLAVAVISAVVSVSGLLWKNRSESAGAVFSYGAVASIALVTGLLFVGGFTQNLQELQTSKILQGNRYDPMTVARLQEAVIGVWPEKNILVGTKSHASAVRFCNGNRWKVPYTNFSKAKYVRTIRNNMILDKYVFFINTIGRLDGKLEKGKFNDTPKNRLYSEVYDRYKDVTKWFREECGFDSDTRVYCLKQVDPESLKP